MYSDEGYVFPETCLSEYHHYRKRYDVDEDHWLLEVADVLIVLEGLSPKPRYVFFLSLFLTMR